MSQGEAAPDVLQDRERKKMDLREPLRFHMYQKRRYGATSSCMALWYVRGFFHSREVCEDPQFPDMHASTHPSLMAARLH